MKYCVLLLVVATALGVPIYPDAEDVQCNSLFQYKKQYSFTYTGTTQTGIIGTDNTTSTTSVVCKKANILVPERCVVVLDLKSCSISPETPQTLALASELVQFQLESRVDENGLFSVVKPNVDESVESLNLKRGILSAAQMEFRGQIEPELHSRHLSIHGNCSTTTTHVGEESSDIQEYIVRKDLSSCTGRPTKAPMLWRGLTYLQNVNLGESLLNSSQECRYQTLHLKNQHMKKVLCEEVHSFWLGSISSDRGIMTRITQQLKFSDMVKLNAQYYAASQYDTRTTSIVQEIPQNDNVERLSTEEAMEYIKLLVGGSLDEVKEDTPRRFGQWVKALRSLDNATIHEVFEKTYNCKTYSEKCRTIPGKAELAREYLWDGLIQCGTLECFAVINTAIAGNLIPKPLAHVMMYTMAFRDYPSLEIIGEGVRLARTNRTQSVILPISTMIYRYWLNNPEIHAERELPEQIHEFVALIDAIIGRDCSVVAERGTLEAVAEERQILLALKAIGNLGPVAQKYDENEVTKKVYFDRELQKCAVNKKISSNVTLAAIQALRRFNPTLVADKVSEEVETMMLDKELGVELRIASFLIYMNLDKFDVPALHGVYVALKEEPSKQFRAFVFSYIANVLESEDPTIQSVREKLALAIAEEELPEYPRNILKYSRNLEISKILTAPYFNKSFGGSIQANIIYDSKAVLPQAAMIKLAMTILGKNWEVVESGIEVQGIEVVMESVFGPSGFFPSNMLRAVFRKADEMIMSKVRSSSISFQWLAKVIEMLKNGTGDLEASLTKAKNAFNKYTATEEEEQETESSDFLPDGVKSGELDEMHETVDKANAEKFAAAYLRILGNDLGFITLDDIKAAIPTINMETLADMASTMATKLSDGVEVNTTRSIQFLERHLILPTGIGMPLSCSANGTAVVSIRSRGQVNVSLPTASMSARFAPSASLELIGTMGIHVPTTKIYTAVMANASIYHNSEIEGNFFLADSAVKVHLKPIRKDLNVVKAGLDYYLLMPNGQIHVVQGIMQDAVQVEKCLTTGELLGATLCMSFAYPNASLVDTAPRFPLTGPVRFGLTMKNKDESVKSYAFQANYNKFVKAGASAKPAKKSKAGFTSIGKKSTFVAPEEVVDAIFVSFSAPGETRARNISTTASFNRNTIEAKWSLDIPEMDDLRLFAGAIKEGNNGRHFVWNATYKAKEASISLTLKNTTIGEKTNYTAVFNASAEQLHFTSVAQWIDTGDFKMASLNHTYYWDNETSLYEQLTFPISGYQIKPEMYHQTVAYIRNFQPSNRKSDTVLHMSALGQNFTVEGNAVIGTKFYENEISSKFVNQWIDFPIANGTYRFDDSTRGKIRYTTRYIDIRRGEHGFFYQEDAEKDTLINTMTRNYTFGVKTTQKVKRPEFTDIEDNRLLANTEEELYHFQPISMNTTLHFAYVNESTGSHYSALNLTFSVPRSMDLTNQTRWGLGSTLRLITDEENVVVQVNQTIPILLLDFSTELALSNNSESTSVSFKHQLMERKYGKSANLVMFSNLGASDMQNGINFTTPYYNYSGSFVVETDEFQGLMIKNRMAQKGGILPDFTDLLRLDYITINPWKNASTGFEITHHLLNVSTNHLVNLEGPVTEFTIKNVPTWFNSLFTDAMSFEVAAIVASLREVSHKITNSSVTVGNDLRVRMPYVINVTMDNSFFLDAERVEHMLDLDVKRPQVNFNVNHTLIGPDEQTNFYNLRTKVSGNVGTMAKLWSTITGKAKLGKSKGLDSKLGMTTTMNVPMIANITAQLNHNIKGMRDLNNFELVEMSVNGNTESILGNTNMDGSAKFETFAKLTKFAKAEVGMTSAIVSRFLNATLTNGWTIADVVRTNWIVAFTRMNTTNTLRVASPLVTIEADSLHEINNAEGLAIGRLNSVNSYQINSLLGNADSSFNWDLRDLNASISKPTMGQSTGTSTFNMNSRLVNVTNSQSLEFVGVEGLFTFEKVGGQISWNADTVLGALMISPMFELNNFLALTEFSRAIAAAEMTMSSEYVGNAAVTAKTGIYEMMDFAMFHEANATIAANANIRQWFVASLDSSGKVKEMEKLFKNKAIIGKTSYQVECPLLNVTGSMSSVTKRMNGFCVFDSMINMWDHEDMTPISGMVASMVTELSNSKGFLDLALFSHNYGLNWTMPLGKVETSFEWTREDSTGAFTFGVGRLALKSAFTSRFLNTSMSAVQTANNMMSFFVFDDYTMETSAEMIVGTILTVKAGRTATTTGSTSLTSFVAYSMDQSASVTMPIATFKTVQTAAMTNWESLFKYERFTGTSVTTLESELVNANSAGLWEVVNRGGLFTFDSAIIDGNATLTSTFCNMAMAGSIVGDTFRGFFDFNKFTTTANLDMSMWELMNMTAAHTSVTSGSTTLTSFEKWTMVNNATIMTPVVSIEVAQGSDMVNLRSLFQYDQFTASSNAKIVSVILNLNNDMTFDITNRDGLFTFGNVVYGMTTDVTTPIGTSKNSVAFTIVKMVALTQSSEIAASFENNMASDILGTCDTTAGVRLINQRSVFIFENATVGASLNILSRFVNVSMAIGSKLVNSRGFFDYELFKMGSSGHVNSTVASMGAEAGIEVREQTGMFVIETASMRAFATANNKLVNLTFTADALLQDLTKFMYFTMATHNAGLTLVSDYQTMDHSYTTSMQESTGPFISKLVEVDYTGINTGIVESISQFDATLVNNNGLGVYDKFAINHHIDLTSMVLNGTTTNVLTITEASGPLYFTLAALSSVTKVTTPLGWTQMAHAVNVDGFRGPMDFDRIRIDSTNGLMSTPVNATANFMYLINDMSGFVKFAEMHTIGNTSATSIVGDFNTASNLFVSRMRGLLKLDTLKVSHNTTMNGPLSTLNLEGNIRLRKIQNITSFKTLNSDYSINFMSLPMNVTSLGDIKVDASNSLFDVELIEGSMVHNISTPYVSHNISSSMVLQDMTSMKEFAKISVNNEIISLTPYSGSIVSLSIGGETGWSNVAQHLSAALTTPAGSVEVSQELDYENAKITLTLPSIAYVHLHGHLNAIGDEFTFKVKHALENEDLVEDLCLLLKLNDSNQIYTNFSWNPEVVADLMDISVDALNRTVNYTMYVFDNTQESLKTFLDLAQETIKDMNATLKEIVENPREFIREHVGLVRYDAFVDKIDTLKRKVEDLLEATLEDPKQAVKDLFAVIKTVIKTTLEEAKAILEDTFETIDEQFMVREKIASLNKTVTMYMEYIYYPKKTWELVKPELESYLEQVKETLKYSLIKETILDIVDIQRMNDKLRELVAKVNMENLKALYTDLKELVNTEKVMEVYEAVMEVDFNVGCVTFKDLQEIDMAKINSTFDKIREFLAVENLKQFINVEKVNEITDLVSRTIRENLDLQLWNETICNYVDVPLLEKTLLELEAYIRTKLNETYEDLKEKADLKVEELKEKYEELKEIVSLSVDELNALIVEVSGLNWIELKERIQQEFSKLMDDLNQKEYIEDFKTMLVELKSNVTSQVNMTKINGAIDQLNTTVCLIIDAAKNESHPINLLPMKLAEKTVYDLFTFSLDKVANVSDEYGKIAFELVKELGQKGKEIYDEYKHIFRKSYRKYSKIIRNKIDELYEDAMEKSDIYKDMALDLLANLTKKADYIKGQLEAKLIEFNQTLNEKYVEYSPILREFVFNATEISIDLTAKIVNYISEKSEPLVTKSLEVLELYWVDLRDLLITYKTETLLYSQDMCVNVTELISKTIEKLPEYREQLLDLIGDYKEVVILFYDDLKTNLTTFKDKAIELASEWNQTLTEMAQSTWAEVIAMAQNEENLLNYYPTEWTGRTVFVLSEETIEYLKEKAEDLQELASNKYDDLKATADEKLEELREMLADPEHKINRIPMEFLEKTILEIYDDLKHNVAILVDDGLNYIEVAKTFVNESIIAINETRLEYNITMDRLQDLIVEYVDQANSSLTLFLEWVQVAKTQDYDVTMKQVVMKFNETLIQAVDTAEVTYSKAIDITNQTLCVAMEMWNNLTRQENLHSIPDMLGEYFELFINTIRKVNETTYDTVAITARIIEILKEDTGIVEKWEDLKERLAEYKEKVDAKIEEYKPIVEEYYLQTREAIETYLEMAKEGVFYQPTLFVEYLNNTLPGWMYRYYRIDALPFEMLNYTLATGKDSIYQFVNSTMTFTKSVIGQFLEYNLDDNSLTMTLTHPFNWTSFREIPTLTDEQMNLISSMFEEIQQRLIGPGRYQIERLSDIISLTYKDLMVYIEEKIEENPKVGQKLEELREKIEEIRSQIETMQIEFDWEYLTATVNESYIIANHFLRENVTAFLKEDVTTLLRENVTRFLGELKNLISTMFEEIQQRLIGPGRYQIERLSDIISLTYKDLMVYIGEKIEENPKVGQKLEELREKIEEIRSQIETLQTEFDWEYLTATVNESYIIANHFLRESVTVFLKEDVTTFLRENVTLFLGELKNTTVSYVTEELKTQATRIAESLKANVTALAKEWRDIAIEWKEDILIRAGELKNDTIDLYNDIQENRKVYYEKVKMLADEMLLDIEGFLLSLPERMAIFMSELHLPTDLSPLIKPWTYKAMIFGANHVMTFDNVIYEHPLYRQSDCTYLLASDFVDGNFSIFSTETTTTLVVRGSFSVKVDQSGEFFLNGSGAPASPPYTSPRNDLLVTRDGPWVNVTTTYGVNMYCNQELFMCIYELSGWYYHKTQGLLGNLDTEHHNEMVMRDDSIADDLIIWLNDYEVTGKSQCQLSADDLPQAGSCTSEKKMQIKAHCQKAFNSSDSHLAPIYKTVDPASFLKECEREADNCKEEEMVTELINNYRALGAFEGIFVHPEICSDDSCAYQVSRVSQADIVFIVSESWRMIKDTSELTLKETLKNLLVKPYATRFAVVAYGGNEYDHCGPHLHSNEFELFNANNLGRAIDSLEFCRDQESCTCSPKKGDALRAIGYASQLKLATDKAKIFVLIDNFEGEYSGDERLAVANILDQNLITFNVFSDYKETKKRVGKIFHIGVNYDGEVLYNKRSSSESQTTTTTVPKGVYAKFATATNGSMYGFNYLMDTERNDDVNKVLKSQTRKQTIAYTGTLLCHTAQDIYGRTTEQCRRMM